MAEMIDPQGAEKREMGQRGANTQFAAQLMVAMCQSRPEIAIQDGPNAGPTPAELFKFAVSVAEEMVKYLRAPIETPSRLV